MVFPVSSWMDIMAQGGPGAALDRSENALNDARMATKLKELEAKYYDARAQSDINNKNSLTREQDITNTYLPEKLRLGNQNQANVNQAYLPNIRSEIAERNALTNKTNTMTPLEAAKMRIENQYAPQQAEATIAARNAMSNLRNMGGSGLGTGAKEEMFYQSLVAKDNPTLSPKQVYEASNVLSEGGDTLSDGTPLNPLSPASRRSLDRDVKSGTTGPLVTQSVRANQADAELKVLQDLSSQDFAPYATTYMGMSPQQIIDTFKTDSASQKRLGRFMASQTAQFEAAQIRNKIAGGEPSASATQELMGRSGQVINAKWPRASAEAREEAAHRMDYYLTKALKARNAVGLSPSTIKNGGDNQGGAQKNKANPSDEDLAFTAKKYNMTIDQVKQKLGMQ